MYHSKFYIKDSTIGLCMRRPAIYLSLSSSFHEACLRFSHWYLPCCDLDWCYFANNSKFSIQGENHKLISTETATQYHPANPKSPDSFAKRSMHIYEENMKIVIHPCTYLVEVIGYRVYTQQFYMLNL